MTKLIFNKKKHTYYVEGVKYKSVTEIIGEQFSCFDANKVAKMLASFPVNKQNKRGVKYWKALWKKQREYGTLVHKDIQDAINTLDDPLTIEGKYAIEWLNNYTRKLSEPMILSEVILYNDEYKIAGTADLIIIYNNPDNELELCAELVDWKVTKEITEKDKYNKPLSAQGLMDTNYWKYSLQLNLYAWMLQQNGFVIKNFWIVQLTPDGVKTFEVHALMDKVGELLELRKREVQKNAKEKR